MTITTEAIYENGMLRPLSPLSLPEHARVRVAVDDLGDETPEDRAVWLAQSERRLSSVWDNPGDDVFNDLLSP
jgi:predicted DNA-binding antitoxin AbrB/MazE fold protein